MDKVRKASTKTSALWDEGEEDSLEKIRGMEEKFFSEIIDDD